MTSKLWQEGTLAFTSRLESNAGPAGMGVGFDFHRIAMMISDRIALVKPKLTLKIRGFRIGFIGFAQLALFTILGLIYIDLIYGQCPI